MTRKDYILIAEALRNEFQSARQAAKASDNAICGYTQYEQGVLASAGVLAEAMARDNARFDRVHFLAVVRGEKALTSRPGSKPVKKITKQFRVAAISSNTNSFGLHNVVLIARDGEAWQVKASGFNVPKQGQQFEFEQTVGELIAQGWELPEQISKAPAGVIAEVWS